MTFTSWPRVFAQLCLGFSPFVEIAFRSIFPPADSLENEGKLLTVALCYRVATFLLFSARNATRVLEVLNWTLFWGWKILNGELKFSFLFLEFLDFCEVLKFEALGILIFKIRRFIKLVKIVLYVLLFRLFKYETYICIDTFLFYFFFCKTRDLIFRNKNSLLLHYLYF